MFHPSRHWVPSSSWSRKQSLAKALGGLFGYWPPVHTGYPQDVLCPCLKHNLRLVFLGASIPYWGKELIGKCGNPVSGVPAVRARGGDCCGTGPRTHSTIFLPPQVAQPQITRPFSCHPFLAPTSTHSPQPLLLGLTILNQSQIFHKWSTIKSCLTLKTSDWWGKY